MRKLSGKIGLLFNSIGLLWSIYLVISVLYPLHSIQNSAITTGVALLLCFAIFPAIKKRSPETKPSMFDWILMIAAITSCGYHAWNYEFFLRNPLLSGGGYVEIILGTILLLLIIEAARRSVGWIVPIMAALMFAYTYFGPYFPGTFAHGGYSHLRVIEVLYLGTRGYAGMLTNIMSTVVCVFIIFGAVLLVTGGGNTITNLAFLMGGRFRGGAAKMAVIASSLFGTINGAAVANVAITGAFTIPMMKKSGYSSEMAAAVESTASTGGQVMPPIMGAGAFIMAELLGIPYLDICIAALLPALLLFYGVGASIHFDSIRSNVQPISKDEIPEIRKVLNIKAIGPLVIPIAVLLYYLIVFYTPSFAAFMAISTLLAIFFFLPPWSMQEVMSRFATVIRGFISAARSMVGLFCMIVCIQLIVSLISITGVGIKFSYLIISASGDRFLLALIMTAVGALLLGMGLPTTAAYVLAVSVLGSVLISLDVDPLAAHMFIYYYAIISTITPPVCIAVYTASGLAESNWLKTAVQAMRLAFSAYLIPFYLVFSQALFLRGSVTDVTLTIITSIIGVTSLSAGTIGYLIRQLKLIERAILIAAALFLINPGLLTDSIGIGMILLVVLSQKMFRDTADIISTDKS